MSYKDPDVQRAYSKRRYVPYASLSEEQKQERRRIKRVYYHKNRELVREKQREQKYGLDYGTIKIILKRQRGLCAICKTELTARYQVAEMRGLRRNVPER